MLDYSLLTVDACSPPFRHTWGHHHRCRPSGAHMGLELWIPLPPGLRASKGLVHLYLSNCTLLRFIKNCSLFQLVFVVFSVWANFSLTLMVNSIKYNGNTDQVGKTCPPFKGPPQPQPWRCRLLSTVKFKLPPCSHLKTFFS